MVYIGVEFIDEVNDRRREFWAKLPYGNTDADNEIPFDAGLYHEFDEWVDDGEDPDWTEEARDEYHDGCNWFWWYLDDEEIKEYEESYEND